MVRSHPGEFEQMALLALAGFTGEATGRQVWEVITSTAGRDVSVAAVHITLARLHDKGWARCRTVEPEPGEGGRPRKRYALAPEGAEALAELRAQHESLWGRASDHPLITGEPG